MHFLYLGVLAALSLGISGANAQNKTQRSVQLSKVIFSPVKLETQRVKVGTICLFSGPALDFGNMDRTLAHERFERLFSTAFVQTGFNVIAKSSNLFDSEDTGSGPDFLVGATFRPKSVDICDSVDGVKGTIGVSVEWQVYDRSTRQVVETISTEGLGQRAKFDASGIDGLVNDAFRDAALKLAAQEKLFKYLGAPMQGN